MIPMVWVISLDIESLLNDVDPMNPDLSTPILDFQAGWKHQQLLKYSKIV